MAQEYIVTQFKKGDFQDAHGNYWCDVALEGVSEPVRIVVKDPMQYKEGMSLFGRITEETSKAGKSYLRFRREKRDDEDGSQTSFTASTGGDKPTDQYWEDKNSAIKAQWAIGQAVAVTNALMAKGDLVDVELLEITAKKFYAMVDRVKASPAPLKVVPLTKAQEDKAEDEEIKDRMSRANEDAVAVSARDMDEPIDLNDIPF